MRIHRILIIYIILKIVSIPECTSLPLLSSTGTVRIPISSFYDEGFVAKIEVGSSSKSEFRVLLDVSSSNFWIPSSNCDRKYGWCTSSRRYDHNKSRTWIDGKETFASTFSGSNPITGVVSIDDVGIKSKSNDIKLNHMEFGEAQLIPLGNIFNGKVDGVLGIDSTKQSKGTGTPFVTELIKNKLIKEPVVSFSPHSSASECCGGESKEVGEVIIGDVDYNSFKGSIEWAKVTDDKSWTVNMQEITFGDTTLCSDACKVETTTNTPLVIGPNDQVNHIYKMLDVRSIPGVIIKTVDCNHVSEFPILSFRVNDVPIMIAPLDYVIKASVGNVEFCYLSITAYEKEQNDKWILGSTIHHSVYIVYHLSDRYVGFAKAL